MVKTYRERHPELYDEKGERKPSTYVCDNCGKIVKAWHWPSGWIGAIPTGFCSYKCSSESMEKVVAQRLAPQGKEDK